ncbi:restriction endonuclease subunit S [Prevotella jejuni]
MREGWEYKTIENCTSIEYGTRVVQKRDGGTIYPVYGGGGETFRMDRYNREDCLIIARFAMSPRCVRYVAGKFFLNDSGLSVKSKEELEQAYLNYHLLFFNDVIYHLGKGAAQRNLDVKAFRQLVIAIPPKPTQLSIVSELDKLNELIQIKKEQLKGYDALAQSIFYEMFGDPVENEKGWEVKKLKDISRKIGDGLHGTPEYSESDTGWYFINGNNLEDGCISIKSTTKKVTDSVRKKYYIEMDDFTLLVSINGTLGKSAFYNGENVILGKSACYIKLNKDVNKLFIYEIIRGEYFKRYAESVCTGTTIRNVSLKAMREFPIIYPSLSLQQSFAHKIEQIECQKTAVQKTIIDLETLLAARMQYWFD